MEKESSCTVLMLLETCTSLVVLAREIADRGAVRDSENVVVPIVVQLDLGILIHSSD